ncbi:hypothetical protein [Streptomyces sp. ST2-7A]|uniref:DUF7848 domain-containing protein n=1 Tax=Streptomyces sp. ST2-7A TaxID=2907214 RepID=UPI001F3B45EA|nr:hypothetical protein [Streptomyces sp. ST2-7A]MCE7081127.1 hypothetical protein [Streptomyces sp. ST2-7A]
MIEPDEEPDAEAITFTAQCAVCEERGPTGDGGGEVTGWMARHLKAHPEHLSYREIITRPYRAVPGAWR